MAAQLYPKSIRVPYIASNHLPFGKDMENVQRAIRESKHNAGIALYRKMLILNDI